PGGITRAETNEGAGGPCSAGAFACLRCLAYSSQPPDRAITPAKIRATVLMTLISGLIEGPAVSLYGSPTVSPTTAAAWASEPLPPWLPSSMYFLALSQAPPPLDIVSAVVRTDAIEPLRQQPGAR